jgi:short-subunit dehydrogenase
MNKMYKVALITGGASGIGKQLAADLLATGAQVIIVSLDPDRLAQAIEDLSGISQKIHSIHCDIGDWESVMQMQEQVLASYGCPDVIINNAGFATYRTFADSDIEEIERLVSVNLLGAMRCTRAFLPCMIARGTGAIVNMASIAGRLVLTPNGTYCAAKHALVAWSETLRYELAHLNIQVNVICPGRVETPFFEHETFKSREKRPETRYKTTVGEVSRATLRAITHNHFITYVPRTLGLLVWLVNTLPFLVKPILERIILSRIKSIYDQRIPL